MLSTCTSLCVWYPVCFYSRRFTNIQYTHTQTNTNKQCNYSFVLQIHTFKMLCSWWLKTQLKSDFIIPCFFLYFQFTLIKIVTKPEPNRENKQTKKDQDHNNINYNKNIHTLTHTHTSCSVLRWSFGSKIPALPKESLFLLIIPRSSASSEQAVCVEWGQLGSGMVWEFWEILTDRSILIAPSEDGLSRAGVSSWRFSNPMLLSFTSRF